MYFLIKQTRTDKKNINFNKVLDTVPENVEDIENYILQAIDYFKRFAP